MALTDKKEAAAKVFDILCASLDHNDWHYKKYDDEDGLRITCTARGDDLPIDLEIRVDEERRMVMLLSRLPFKMAEDKLLDGAIAVSAANYKLANGCFDYDIKSGFLAFRMTCSYVENTLSEELFQYMLLCSASTVDEFNDKFFMLSKGMLSIEAFLTSINE